MVYRMIKIGDKYEFTDITKKSWCVCSSCQRYQIFVKYGNDLYISHYSFLPMDDFITTLVNHKGDIYNNFLNKGIKI
jgi:hypothetical protein